MFKIGLSEWTFAKNDEKSLKFAQDIEEYVKNLLLVEVATIQSHQDQWIYLVWTVVGLRTLKQFQDLCITAKGKKPKVVFLWRQCLNHLNWKIW